MNDPVNNPSHYTSGGVKVIDVIEAFDLNFRLANVIKYVLRSGRKGDALEDLEKAAWYLDREIDKLYQQAEADEAADEPTHAKPVACAERPNVGDEVEEGGGKTFGVNITIVEQSSPEAVFHDRPEYDG